MADHLIKWIEPIRQRRQDYEAAAASPRISGHGLKARALVAQQTMDRVREAGFHWNEKRGEIGGRKREVKNTPAGPPSPLG